MSKPLLNNSTAVTMCRSIERIADRGPSAPLDGTSLVISLCGEMWLALGSHVPVTGTVAIPMPVKKTVTDLLAVFNRSDCHYHIIVALQELGGVPSCDGCPEIGYAITQFLAMFRTTTQVPYVSHARLSHNNNGEIVDPFGYCYRASPLAEQAANHLRQRLNALPAIQVWGLAFSTKGVAICLEQSDLSGHKLLVDLSKHVVTACNIAAALGHRDVANSVGALLDMATGLSACDATSAARMISTTSFQTVSQYPLEQAPPPD